MAPAASLPFVRHHPMSFYLSLSVNKINSFTSRILFVLIIILVVDDIASLKVNNKVRGEAARPLYGIILNAPYPKQNYVKPPVYHQPYKPFRPVYRPHPPVPYVQPQPSYYPPPPPYYPVAPPPPPYRPPPTPYTPPVTPSYPQPEPYRPPATPAYQTTTSVPYRPPVRPSGSRPVTFPVPTTFDNKPWEPMIPTSASYILDPAFQLNEIDGYPWTQQLREVDDHEENLKDKLPELLFRDKIPSKSLAQQHASENDINFIPNPELRI